MLSSTDYPGLLTMNQHYHQSRPSKTMLLQPLKIDNYTAHDPSPNITHTLRALELDPCNAMYVMRKG